MKSICFLTVALLLSMNVFSQFKISGSVHDESDQPLVGANVSLVNPAKHTNSDYFGEFIFKNLPSGEYQLEISFVGYETFQKSVTIADGDVVVNAQLTMKAEQLQEVVVKGTRANKNTPVAQKEISYEDIEKNNLGQDLPFLLQNEVSMVATSDAGAGVGYTGFRLRGSDASRINVTVNGIPINDSESQGVYWVNMPDLTSSVQNIQIQRGVGTSTNGAGAFGGSVNLQTTTLNDKAYGEIATSYGSFNTQKYNAKFGTGLINEHWAFDGRASMISSDGYIDRASSDLKSYYLSGGYYGDKTVVKLIHFAGREKTYQSWWGTPESRINGDVAAMEAHAMNNGLDSAQTANLINAGRTYNYYEYDNETDNYGQDHFQLHFSHQVNKQLTANAALHYTHGAGYYEQFRQDDDFASYGMNNLMIGGDTITSSDLIRRRWLDNDFYGMTYNFLYKKDKLNMTLGGAYNEYDGGHFGEIIWMEFANGSDIRDRYYDNDGVKKDFNTYLKSDYQINDKMISFVDLQVRSIDYTNKGIDNDLRTLAVDTSFFFFNPKAGLSYKLKKNLRSYVSVAVANREPVRNDFIDNPANAQPKHENMVDYELGIDWTGKKASFTGNAYFMNYTNQLILTGALNDVGSPIRTNVDKSYRAGLELAGSIAISKKFKAIANATLSQNKIANFTEVIYDYTNGFDIIENQFENTDIAFSPNLISAFGVEYKILNSLSLMVQSKYVGKQYLDNTSNDDKAIAAYQTVDARLSYSIFPKKMKELSVNILANNILNTMYSSNGYTYSYVWGDMITENFYYPQAGINFLGGLTLKF